MRSGLLSRVLWLVACMAAMGSGCSKPSPPAGNTGGRSGAELFREHCAMCHPDGGNILYPQKSLQKGVLAANGITTPKGIVARMRNPGPGMKRFDRSELDDAKAIKIAEYVLEAFR